MRKRNKKHWVERLPSLACGGIARPGSAKDTCGLLWFEELFLQKLEKLEDNYKTYRLSESVVDLYSFIWDGNIAIHPNLEVQL